ncbi:TIGR02680 family protein [Streptomyces sp. NPDC005167]
MLGRVALFVRDKDYRVEVASRLFGFSSARLRSLVDLLLTLRRPKLSEDFNVEKLSAMLVDGLPPVSTALLEDLAGKFEELARDREEMQTLVRDKAQIDTFLSSYARLARRIVHHDAQQLIHAGAHRRAAQSGLTAKLNQLQKAQAEIAEIDRERTRLELRGNTLQTSLIELQMRPEMEQRGLIIELQKQVSEAETLLAKADTRHRETAEHRTAAEGELEQETARGIQVRAQLEQLQDDADGHARHTALHDAHRGAHGLIRSDPPAARRTLTGLVGARSGILEQTLTLATQADEARSKHEAFAAVCRDLLARSSDAKTSCDATEAELKQRIEALRAFLIDWAERCQQLRLTDTQLASLLEAVPSLGQQGSPALAELVATQARSIERDLNTALARQQVALDQLHARHQELTAERDATAAQNDPVPPAPPAPRRARQPGLQDGAPLWKLLEFSPSLTETQAALLEAALLDAGILDAWVTPEGQALAADTLETILLPIPQNEQTPSLADALHAHDHPLIPAQVTHKILSSIALTDHDMEPGDGAHIGLDGSWHVGPLHGRTTGTAAAYIGAAARAAEKKRRLAALDTQLHALATRIEAQDQEISSTCHRIDDLDAERTEPQHKDQDLRTAQQALDTARTMFEQLDRQAQGALEEKNRLWEIQQHAERELDDYARPRGVPLHSHAITAEHSALQRYQATISNLLHAAENCLAHAALSKKAKHRLAQLDSQLLTRAFELKEATQSLANKQEKLRVRQDLSGADVDKIVAEIDEAHREQEAVSRQRKAKDTDFSAGTARAGALTEAVATARERAMDSDRARTSAADDYRRLASCGYLGLAGLTAALHEEADKVEEQAHTAAAHLADEPYTEQAINDARNEADEKFRFLQNELAGPDWRPRSRSDVNLLLVSVLHNGEPLTVPDVQGLMANEIHTRRTLLDEGEHKLFTEVLLGRLGDHLRKRRAEASSLIERMNTLLQAAPTTSGLLMKIIWEADPSQSPDIVEALTTLDSQSSRHLSHTARERLIRFLVGKVEAAREKEGTADWRVHLREALDYRRWNRIRLRYKPAPDQKWTNLTDQKQQKGSGGEKAVLLQFPLFVAAAAHYQGAAPTAPRPVYLDEAFAGIDAEMRGRCLGLLTSLDLDFVMASHDEWGFHKEVPGVATYQLFRHPGIPGVLTTPIIWDGTDRHDDLPDPALRHTSSDTAGLDWDDEEDDLDEQFAEDDSTSDTDEHFEDSDDDEDG